MSVAFKETSAIKMVYEFGRYVVLCDYGDRHIPKAAHFFWDSHRGAWVTNSHRWASALLMYADKDCKRRILDRVVPTLDPPMFKPSKAGRFGNHA